MTQLSPTPEQQEIISSLLQGGSLMISAFAGCAKTSTLKMAAPQIRVPALALAFNKKIKDDLAEALPGNFMVKTLNGLGHGALQKGLGKRLRLDDRKLGKLVTETAKELHVDLTSEDWDGLRRLVSMAQQNGILPLREGGLLEDSEEAWNDLGSEIGFPNPNVELAREILIRNNQITLEGGISFDDQIYGSIFLGGAFPHYPVVFVDEAQDLSPLNHEMLRRVGEGRLVVVGDPKQAIYAFRGADSRSMESLRRLRPLDDWRDLPLATTFRCPKRIVERQQGHAQGFRAWHTNPEGRVTSFQDLSQGWQWRDIEDLRFELNPSARVAVLCRNNAPLMSLAFKMIRRGIPGIEMAGRDLGKGLLLLSRKILPEDDLEVSAMVGRIEEWRITEASKARAMGKDRAEESIHDRAECLLAVISGAEVQDAGSLRLMLEKLFEKKGGILLSSIHRAKGLEWDLVLHLDPWRIPSRQARAMGGRALEQERNLEYVAETRTRHTLVLGNLEGFR